VEILQAYSRHLSLLVSIFDEYRQFYGQSTDSAGARLFLADRLERRDSVIYFASEGSGSQQRALGFTQLYPSFSSVWMKRVWMLNDLFVQAGSRRQGIGKALLNRGRQLAMETRAHGLVLGATRDNQTAKQLCENAGYRLDEEFDYYLLRTDA
jgi:GNAT superfamily N-acetyltransferase